MEYADWVLPLGISYYTFQSMGYLIDVYQRKYDPEKSLLRTALFVFYFPQLTVGPISRFDRLKEELYSPHRFSMDRLEGRECSGDILKSWWWQTGSGLLHP